MPGQNQQERAFLIPICKLLLISHTFSILKIIIRENVGKINTNLMTDKKTYTQSKALN